MSQNRFSKWILCTALALVGVVGCSDQAQRPLAPTSETFLPEQSGLVGQEIVISLAPGWTFEQVATANGWTLLESNSASGLATYDDNGSMKHGVQKTPSGVVTVELNTPDISAEPPPGGWDDGWLFFGGGPDDVGDQASLAMFNLDEVHETNRGQDVRIALIDSGVDILHPALVPVLYYGPFSKAECAAVGGQGHGTATAGCIVAMAPGAEILPIDIFRGSPSASPYDLANAMQIALDYSADVVCIPLSAPSSSDVVDAKFEALAAAGTIVVAAAGNTHNGSPTYPATNTHVLAIAATTEHDLLTSFSALGARFAALGEGIDTLWLPIDGQPGAMTVRGTSFSAGLVAGYFALAIRGANGGKSAAQLIADTKADAVRVTGVTDGRVNTDRFIDHGLPFPGGH